MLNVRRSWLYVVVCFCVYAFYNEILARLGLFGKAEDWESLFIGIRLFTYLLNAYILYLVLFGSVNLLRFLLIHIDIPIFSMGFLYYNHDAILPLVGWSMFRYGYLGFIFLRSYEYIHSLIGLSFDGSTWIWIAIYGLGGYALVMLQMVLVHSISYISVKLLCVVLRCD